MTAWRFCAVLAATLLVLAPAQANDLEKADPAVQYRINIMRGMAANASAIGLTIRNNLPQGQNLALHAEAIALDARAAISGFQPNVDDNVVKPEVWSNWKDFSDRLNALSTTANEVAKLAREGGLDAAKPKLDVMMPMC